MLYPGLASLSQLHVDIRMFLHDAKGSTTLIMSGTTVYSALTAPS